MITFDPSQHMSKYGDEYVINLLRHYKMTLRQMLSDLYPRVYDIECWENYVVVYPLTWMSETDMILDLEWAVYHLQSKRDWNLPVPTYYREQCWITQALRYWRR